ncbi:hypothetical protein H2204_012191 [Knufia peltigerae]|uniref:Serine/threonine-protein kinase ATG1 n=1 Tax=Knufia peltigerae TaxID=1002370 RepID=A0AA39CT87_9EURO|nr:hypothetical protein H2204_012191 [Knufia peltigerae]
MIGKADIDLLKLEIKGSYREGFVERVHAPDRDLGLPDSYTTTTWDREEEYFARGTYGTLHLEKERDARGRPARVRVVKLLKIDDLNAEWHRELDALVEFSHLRYYDSGSFVDFDGWFANRNFVYLFMEYLELKSLHDVVGANSLAENEILTIAIQILQGVSTMHASGYVHRDLKPQNILVAVQSPDWWVKIADFGLTKAISNETLARTAGRGSEGYAAPEVFRETRSRDDRDTSHYDYLVDVWSIGCILFRLLTGAVPFEGDDVKDHYSNLSSFLITMKIGPRMITADFTFALQEMLQPNPRRRISAENALVSSWIKGAPAAARRDRRRPRTSRCLTRNITFEERRSILMDVQPEIRRQGLTNTTEALHRLAMQGDVRMVRSLLELGVDANSPWIFEAALSESSLKGKVSRTPIASAASISFEQDTCMETMEMLRLGGCDMNDSPSLPGATAITALHAATSAGFADRVDWLLNNGCRKSIEKVCGELRPLHVAAQGRAYQHTDIVACLLKHKAVVNARAGGPLGATAIHYAAQLGLDRTVDELLSRGADINMSTTLTERTPLHITIVGMGRYSSRLVIPIPTSSRHATQQMGLSENRLAVAKVLLKHHQLNLRAIDADRMTALHYAARYQETMFARELIEAAQGQRSLLNMECMGATAYQMAWEATERAKESVIANMLEAYATPENVALRRKRTNPNIWRRLIGRNRNVTPARGHLALRVFDDESVVDNEWS